MKNLNKASYDVWSEYLKEESNQRITDRILILDTYETLTVDETKELEILLNLEKKFIVESEIIAEKNKKYLKVFNSYKKKLEKDQRLLTIFYERVSNNLFRNDKCDENDLKNIYIGLMEEDMDVAGHDQLTKIYQQIQTEETCTTPNCIYCTPITNDEFADAFEDLNEQGFLDKTIPEQERLVKLMVTIHRLQDELAIYKPGENDDDDIEEDLDD